MFKKQMVNFTNMLIEKEIIESNSREIIIHGLCSGVELVLNIMTTIFIGVVLGLFIESVIFLVSFSLIRTYAGGYHCKKAISCYLVSTISVLIILSVISFVPQGYTLVISVIMLVISIPVILSLAPLGTRNKRIDAIEKIYFKKRVRINLLIECIIFFILLLLKIEIVAFVIANGLIICSFLLIIEKYIQSRIYKY